MALDMFKGEIARKIIARKKKIAGKEEINILSNFIDSRLW